MVGSEQHWPIVVLEWHSIFAMRGANSSFAMNGYRDLNGHWHQLSRLSLKTTTPPRRLRLPLHFESFVC